jgi:hypothetical protein
MLQRHRESAYGRSKLAWRIIPRSSLNVMMTVLHGWPPGGGHVGVKKPWIISGWNTTGSRQERTLKLVPAWRGLCSKTRHPDHDLGANASVEYRVPVRKDSHRCSRDLPMERPRNRLFLIAMYHFIKWLEAYATPNQEASTVAETPVTNFCRFGVPYEVCSNQGRNFETRLIQALHRLE